MWNQSTTSVAATPAMNQRNNFVLSLLVGFTGVIGVVFEVNFFVAIVLFPFLVGELFAPPVIICYTT